jgi:arylformamidase
MSDPSVPLAATASSALRSPQWHDAQYDNRARVADALQILALWADRSAAARAALACRLDIAYGPDPGERLDVFPAATSGAPVLVYIHGGYWRALDKRDASFVAPPFVAAGALVVVPNYALCPAASIDEIVRQQQAALAWVWRHAGAHGGDRDRIVVAGHSAGGHLAATMLATDWPAFDPALPADLVKGALSLSGVFELEPLRHAPFLAPDLKLDAAAAARLSPVGLAAPTRPLYALVGADESEEFQRQNDAIAAAWGPTAVPVCESVPGRNHMSVLFELAEPGSRTHRLALELLGLAG